MELCGLPKFLRLFLFPVSASHIAERSAWAERRVRDEWRLRRERLYVQLFFWLLRGRGRLRISSRFRLCAIFSRKNMRVLQVLFRVDMLAMILLALLTSLFLASGFGGILRTTLPSSKSTAAN